MTPSKHLLNTTSSANRYFFADFLARRRYPFVAVGRPAIKIFGKKFRSEVREAQFLTQLEAAERVGIREKRYQKIEGSEVIAVDLKRIPLMATLAKLSVDDFVAKFGANGAEPTPRTTAEERLARELVLLASLSWDERAGVAARLPAPAALALAETFAAQVRKEQKVKTGAGQQARQILDEHGRNRPKKPPAAAKPPRRKTG